MESSPAPPPSYLLNDNTARALNYGFHAELLYAWFIPWLLDAGLRGHRRSFLLATMACVLVKEDAVLPLFAVSTALGLLAGSRMTNRDRILYLVVPTTLALINLGLFYTFVVPALAPGGQLFYANFWMTYGATPVEALRGMISRPWSVVSDAVTSGFPRVVMPPHSSSCRRLGGDGRWGPFPSCSSLVRPTTSRCADSDSITPSCSCHSSFSALLPAR